MESAEVPTPREVLDAIFKKKLAPEFLRSLNEEIINSFSIRTNKAVVTKNYVGNGEACSDTWSLVKKLYREKGWLVYEDDYDQSIITFEKDGDDE
jgi:hypothetical protein